MQKRKMYYKEWGGGGRASTLTCPIMGERGESKGRMKQANENSIFISIFLKFLFVCVREREGKKGASGSDRNSFLFCFFSEARKSCRTFCAVMRRSSSWRIPSHQFSATGFIFPKRGAASRWGRANGQKGAHNKDRHQMKFKRKKKRK